MFATNAAPQSFLLIGEDDCNMAQPKPGFQRLYDEAQEKTKRLDEKRKAVE